ncbi:MAG: hypothetical protein WDM87_02980 [Terracidiphilus sp.]
MRDDAWCLDDLVARFEAHPEFREVYVEGQDDIGLVQWFLEQNDLGDVVVYPIDSFDITEESATACGLSHLDRTSNRTDVITLALHLQREVPVAAGHVTCIADADLQHCFPETYDSKFLIFTDYTSMEMYAFRPELITKLLHIAAPNVRCSGEEVLTAMTHVLESLFAFRGANCRLKWGLSWIRFDKDLRFTGATIVFDEARFVQKYLNTKGRTRDLAAFQSEVANVRTSFGADHRLQIRGHDFTELLTIYLRKVAYRSFQDLTENQLRDNLFSQLQIADLASEPLFINLIQKYRPA